MSESQRLSGIRAKIERAKKHISDVNVEILSFLKTDPYKSRPSAIRTRES